MKKILVLAAVLLMFGTANAFAVTFDFNFAGSSPASTTATSLTWLDTTSALSVLITASTSNAGYSAVPVYDGSGLGVNSEQPGTSDTDLYELDVNVGLVGGSFSNPYYENLILDFGQNVTLGMGNFTDLAGYPTADLFMLYVDGVQKIASGNPVDDAPEVTDQDPFNFSSLSLTGQVFRFTVPTSGYNAYQLATLSVTSGDVVPEPASMVLMGIGLAGAAFRRRRR